MLGQSPFAPLDTATSTTISLCLCSYQTNETCTLETPSHTGTSFTTRDIPNHRLLDQCATWRPPVQWFSSQEPQRAWSLHPPVTMWHDSSNLKVAVSTSCFYSWRSSLVTGAPFIRCRPCTWWLTASLPYAGSYACAIVTYNSFQYSQNTHTSPLRGLCRAMTKGAGKGVAPRLHTHTP